MKKTLYKNKRNLIKTLRSPRKINKNEKAIDSGILDRDITEEFGDLAPAVLDDNSVVLNGTEAVDRGDDLVNIRDHFIQQPDISAEIPPELVQLPNTDDNVGPAENLADRFEAERKTR